MVKKIEKQSIIGTHFENVDSKKIVRKNDMLTCPVCDSTNVELLPTNSGNSKLICHTCNHKIKNKLFDSGIVKFILISGLIFLACMAFNLI